MYIFGMDRDALQQFVSRSRERLDIILQRMQWTETGVHQQNHGYKSGSDEAEGSFPPSCHDSTYSIQLNEDTVKRILQTKTEISAPNPPLPQTFDMLQSSYTAEQKLLIYQFILANTPSPQSVFEDYAAFAKMVAVTKREHFKQRRHRKSKPTFNEELHALVELQMKALLQQQQPEKPKPDTITNHHRKEHKKKGKYSRSPDRSRTCSRSKEKETHRSKHKHKKSRSRSRSGYHPSSHNKHS